MHSTLFVRCLRAMYCCLAALVMSFLLYATGPFQSLERHAWDVRVAFLAKPGAATSDIVLIVLDQDSLDWAQKENSLAWPWPREMYGVILDYCARAGAASVAIDVLFTEPSFYGVDDDIAFGEALARNGRTILAVFPGNDSGSSFTWPDIFPKTRSAVDTPKPPLPAYARASFPVREIGRKAAAFGSVNQPPDTDGIYRHVHLLSAFGELPLPSISLATYLMGRSNIVVRQKSGQLVVDMPNKYSRRARSFKDMTVFLDSEGRALLNYRGKSGVYMPLSAASIIRSELLAREGKDGSPDTVPLDVLKDKHVFFGFTAPGLFDLRPAPVGGVFTGVEVQATALDNLLSNDFMREAPLAVTLAASLALGFAVALVSLLGGRAVVLTPSILAVLSLPFVLGVFAYRGGWWLPVTPVAMTAFLAFIFSFVYGYATEGRQRRFLKKAFSQYMNEEIIEEIIKEPDKLRLGGERRVLTMFFSDLASFTALSEQLGDPVIVTRILGDYMAAMTAIILEEGGTLDKYVGDGIIAFWNAPKSQQDHAERGVRAALRCTEKLEAMREHFIKLAGSPLRMRIGLHTGITVVGNIGSNLRFAYTMVGDSVNLASRLEGVNKVTGTKVLISGDTASKLGSGLVTRPLGRVAVTGRGEAVPIFEPMFREEAARRVTSLAVFEEALAIFQSGDIAEARRLFASVAEEDGAARAYVAICNDVEKSMPEVWDGVIRMRDK